jgi:hypothetical protein
MKSGDPEGCKTEIKVKEQCLYICSTFHRNPTVFNNEHYVHMRVPDEDYSTNKGRWFSPGTPVSSTTKTGRHYIAEILLKVALKHQK